MDNRGRRGRTKRRLTASELQRDLALPGTNPDLMRRAWGKERRWSLLAALGCGALLWLFMTAASASAGQAAGPGFSAHGSAEQVYVTGLKSKQRMRLVDRSGHAVQTTRADGLGAL